MRRPVLDPLVLSGDEREQLERWARRPKSSQALAFRCRIVLACAQGESNTAVAARLGVARSSVNKWRARFVAQRLDGLHDEPRPGAPRSIGDDDVEKLIVKLRWIGQDEEAAGLCSQLARLDPKGGTALWPRDTD